MNSNGSVTQATAYIAGPMSGYPEYNFPAFDAAQARLEALGFKVISPAQIDRDEGFDPTKDEVTPELMADIVRRDIEAIIKSDIIILLDGWEDSKGAVAEANVGRWLNKPIKEFQDYAAL